MRTPPFTDEHDQLRRSVRRVVRDELAPEASGWEEHGAIPAAVLGRLGELGLLGLRVPTADGGEGGDAAAGVVLAEELAGAGSGSLTAIVGPLVTVALPLLAMAATAPEHHQLLHRALRGRARVALAGIEPDTTEATTDPRPAGAPIARRDGDGWRLDGSSPVVVGGASASAVIVALPTGHSPGGDATDDRSLFLVETGLAGVRVDPLDRVGLRASGAAALRLDGVRVPATALVGAVGRTDDLLAGLRAERALWAAAATVAAARRTWEVTVSYTRQREAFGRPVVRFQAVRHLLVDLLADIDATQALVHATLSAHIRDAADPALVAACTLRANQLGFQVTDGALQLHGGAGYSRELEVERLWRDARLQRIDEVGDELARERIARRLPRPATDPWPGGALDGDLVDPGHHALRARARRFIQEEIAPHVDDWERDEDLPRELFRRAGAAGLLGLRFPPEVGGSGPDLVAQAIWTVELAGCLSGGVAADLGASTDLAAVYVWNAGSPDQQRRLLPPLLSGERIGALAITEPGAGSDVAAIGTRARRDGDGWVIDGTKVFITNGSWCDDVVVATKVTPEDGAPSASPHGQITLFHVRADDAGVTRRRMRMLGWRTSHTGELVFDGVRVGDDRRLGQVGEGFAHITTAFAWERLVMSLGAVATAERTLELALELVLEPPATAGVVRAPAAGRSTAGHDVAELWSRVAAARALTVRALRLVVAGEGDTGAEPASVMRTVASAKLVTQRLAFEVADACLQLAGSAGTETSSPIQRVWRDTRLGPIGGGTDQIMREIVARTAGL